MSKRALLIGCQTYGLSGCHGDVALMQQTLAGLGFEHIDARIDTDATRAGILDGLAELTVAAAPGDALVVYYSGHGGRVARPDFAARTAAGLSPHYQFIVPADMEDSGPGDFRGILSEELTALQRAAAEATRSADRPPNMTTILDCCHSGYMARDVDAIAKNIDAAARGFRLKGIREHVEGLGGAAALHGLETNPDVVRVVACAPEQSAFELPSSRGGRHGALTDALCTLLSEPASTRMSWRTVGELIRRRVRTLVPEQRPEIEGPAERILFSSECLPGGCLPVTIVAGQPAIEGAVLLGVQPGDLFHVLVPGVDQPVGTAKLTNLVDGNGILSSRDAAAKAALAEHALLVPKRVSLPRLAVRLDLGDVDPRPLRAALRASTRLDEHDGDAAPFASVGHDAEMIWLGDAGGARWRTTAVTPDAAGSTAMVEALEAVAVGHRLLDLRSGDGAAAIEPLEITFAALHPPRQLADRGERLAIGQRIRLRLRNLSAEPRFVWVFDVGVSGRSSLVTDASPSGTRLGEAGAEDDTVEVWDEDGEALFWPSDVPAPGAGEPPRRETFVVLTANRRSDLSGLASRATARSDATMDELDLVLEEARSGRREVSPASANGSGLRYRLDTIEFLLGPA